MDILAILVIYNQNIAESKTCKSLLINYEQKPVAFKNFKLIIYDNGSYDQINSIKIPFNHKYVFNSKNDGLAVAYNYALKEGIRDNFRWLLLLDQDSMLPPDFIDCLNKDLMRAGADSNIKAIAPKMKYDGHFFSPSKVLFGGIHRPIDTHIIGICSFEVFAIGSCSLIDISFFQNIGGFNEFFWLDCLDRWIYFEIHKHGGKVFITNTIIEHELSVMDYSKFINAKRYNNIMIYETYFMKFYKSKSENLIYYLRLIKRVFAFSISKKNRKYSLLTLQHLKDIFLKRCLDLNPLSS